MAISRVFDGVRVVAQNQAFWHIAIALGMFGFLTMPVEAMVGDRARLPLKSFTPALPVGAIALTPDSRLPTPDSLTIAQHFTCPATLEPLTAALLRDLPGYINRSMFRLTPPRTGSPTYAVVASQPDFTPLPTDSSEYQSPNDANLHQVFFTVLERQYINKRVVEFQQFHWLFLTRTTGGWRLALLFSQIGSYPVDRQPLTPPRESSQSVTADAIRSWLRNCEAGAVKV